jgi:hypothetical protein
MTIVYQSEYKTSYFYPDQSILEEVWHTESAHLTDELYRKEVMAFVELLNKYKPRKTLQNTQNLLFILNPETQAWLNSVVMPATFINDNQKLAIVISKDFFTQISVEQTLEENPEIQPFITRYFSDSNDAMKWLIEN